MALLTTVPKRKRKPKPNPWDRQQDFQALKAAITGGRMTPKETRTMLIDVAEMGPKLCLKDPARAAADAMRRFIREMGLSTDYWSEKFETRTPGQYALVVCYDPPEPVLKEKP